MTQYMLSCEDILRCMSRLLQHVPTADATILRVGQEYTSSVTRIADNGNRSKATLLSVLTGKSEKQIDTRKIK